MSRKIPPITANTIQRLRQVFMSSLRTRLMMVITESALPKGLTAAEQAAVAADR